MRKNIKKLALKYERVKSRVSRRSTMQITDNREIVVDGCKKIVGCDENIVVIDLTCNRVTIMGDSLRLRNWGSDGVVITGTVQSIEFSTGGNSC